MAKFEIVEKKEPASIPKVTLKADPIQFDGDCVDPLALSVILDALDYSIDTSERRLTSLGKAFPVVEQSGKTSLGIVLGIREALAKAPLCKPVEGEPVMLPPRPRTPKETPKAEKPKAPEKAKAEPIKAEKPEVPERTLPGLWPEAILTDAEGKVIRKFDNPSQAAQALGLKIRGYDDIPTAFRKQGYDVSGNGKPVKGESKRFLIRPKEGTKIKLIEPKEVEPWVKEPEPKATYRGPFIKVTTKEGKVSYEDADGKPLPKELWPKEAAPSKLMSDIWQTLPVDARVKIAERAGLEGKAGSKEWKSMTADEQEKLTRSFTGK